jgi:hypothetical protein
MHMLPTMHLRWSATSGKLQQGWASSYGGPLEWRDVPLEQEAPVAQKKGFDHAAFTAAVFRVVDTRGWSAKQLSEATGVSETTLSRMRGGRQPDAASMAALSAWAGINPAKFVTAEPATS